MKTDYLKQYFYIISLSIIVMALTGCAEEEESDFSIASGLIGDSTPNIEPRDLLTEDEVNYDLSKVPQGVKKGVITTEYFTLLMELIDEITEYNEANTQLNTDTILTEREISEERVRLNRELQNYIYTVHYVPTNDVEQEIHNYTTEVIIRLDDMANYRIKYHEGDKSYRKLASDAADVYTVTVETWAMVMDDYELFLEE